MNAWGFDTETAAFRPGLKAPPMACLTYQQQGESRPSILHAKDAKATFVAALQSGSVIVGHNVAYDMAVCCAQWPDLVPQIFQAYEDNRVTDTMLREQLWDIAEGKYRGYADERGVWRKNSYGLDAVARKRAGIVLKKDGWRRRYGEFIDIPLAEWPARAAELSALAKVQVDAGVDDKDLAAIAVDDPSRVVSYPLDDAQATLLAKLGQDQAARTSGVFADEYRQARGAFWLQLMSVWGLRTRADGVEMLRLATEAEVDRLTADLVKAGLIRTDGTRDTKAATARMVEVMAAQGREPRKTKGGGICLDRDACKESEDPILIDYGNRAQMKAVLDKDIPMLLQGVVMPIHTSIGLAESGRTTSYSPNIQNLRRVIGVREAFVSRIGRVFAQCDYPTLELRTLAQVCIDLFGFSKLAEMLNAGKDPHLAFAATAVGMPYELALEIYKDKGHRRYKEIKNLRDTGKVFNFGSPGGLGAANLVLFARKTYNVPLAKEEAKAFKKVWLETFPEMSLFFDHVGRLADTPSKEATIKQLRSNRIRGGAKYTAACNSYFQGLGADATKHAGFLISKACYVDRSSPLYGSRIAAFVHDEFLVETKDNDNAHDAAHELARLMRVGANEWLPDVPFGEMDPLLMRTWSKEAEPLTDANGRLIPWDVDIGGALSLARGLKSFVDARPTLDVAA